MSIIVIGIVVPGDRRGRLLGFPTANVLPDAPTPLPDDGVFAGHVERADGSHYGAAISIGRRPTYYTDEAERLVEAHLLDFDDDLYGERLIVSVGERVRGQERFDSSEALIAKITSDVAKVRQLLSREDAK